MLILHHPPTQSRELKPKMISMAKMVTQTGKAVGGLSAMAAQIGKVFTGLTAMAAHTGKAAAGVTVMFAMFQKYFPCELRDVIMDFYEKFVNFVYPYIQITFPEYQGNYFERSKAYAAIERYLNAHSTNQAKRLQANVFDDSDAVVLSVAKNQEVTDDFNGIKLWWTSSEDDPRKQSISFWPREDEKRYFRLSFYRKHRHVITGDYLKHVMEQGKAITVRERRRKLCTNNQSDGGGYPGRGGFWSEVAFEHPASFDTLAMDKGRKQEIVNDLIYFSKSEDYYKKAGKAWKRGYLLHGPPGTGKSTMIAAMANLLKYDVYDLELTAVKNNTELRKLLINTTSKSVIVIEDIDCSLQEVTAQREEKEKDKDDEEGKDPVKEKIEEQEKKKKHSEVTLSGLLNTIDGLWSACPGERIIVFTTNHVDKLDKALIRRGRMDEHIELSYCGFDAFKILAKNYLDIDSHELFAKIRQLLEETAMTPADVADKLMRKSDDDDADSNLMRLIRALEEAKAEEEAGKLGKEEEEKKQEVMKESGEECVVANGVKRKWCN